MASSSPFLLGPSGFRRWLVFLLVLGISAKAGWWTSPLPISSVWIFKTITCLLVPVHAQCISILYPHALFATTTTANRNLSLLVLFTAIVNVLTPLLFTPIESAIMTLMPYKELLNNYGPGPHWGTLRKKMSPAGNKVYVSHVYYRIYIMITRSLSRWHSRRCACGSEP